MATASSPSRRAVIDIGTNSVKLLVADVSDTHVTPVFEVVNRIFELADSEGSPMLGALSDRPGEDEIQVADIDRTQKLLDWKAQITLNDGLQKLIDSLPK